MNKIEFIRRCRPGSAFFAVLGFGVFILSGLFGGPGATADQHQGALAPNAPVEINVASNGWHSAIFVARHNLPPNSIPEVEDFPKARFVGFGWGDAEYFPARDPGFATLLTAAFQPTPSVIHVTGLRSPPRMAFPNDEVIALTISADGFQQLLIFLNKTFFRAGAKRAKPVAAGLHPFSAFYRARGEFHVFNNCNSWTARALAAAGLPIDASSIVRAEDLMTKLRDVAK